MSQDFNTAWRKSLADALGFVGGGVIGLLAGRALGWEFLTPGWGAPQVLGLLMILVCMGVTCVVMRRLLLGPKR